MGFLFVWNPFGVMATPEEDDKYLYAVNVAGDRRKMSKGKYPNWGIIREKLIMLEGKNCLIRTSQTTANWSTSVWFSDVTLDDGEQDLSPIPGDEQETESVEELKNKILTLENQVQEQGDKIRQKDEQLLKKEDRLQDERAKTNALQSELAEMEVEKAKIESDIRSLKDLPQSEQEEVKKYQENIDEENLIRSRKPIRVKGHPERTLALRLGLIIEDNEIEAEFIASLGSNLFRVNFVDYGISGIVVLGYDSEYYAKTFYNLRSNWFPTVKKATGIDESDIKDDKELSLEQLVKWHEKIAGY